MVVLEHSIPQLCITLTEKVITEYKEKQITIGKCTGRWESAMIPMKRWRY